LALAKVKVCIYTGVVFEAYFDESEVTSSVAGGGRYDKMIGSMLDRPDEYPAVGISFGLAPIMDALRTKTSKKTRTRVFVAPIKTLAACNLLAKELRTAGVNTDVDLLGRGVSKNLDYANALGIPYVIIVGQKELDAGKYTLKDMVSGEEAQLSMEELTARLS